MIFWFDWPDLGDAAQRAAPERRVLCVGGPDGTRDAADGAVSGGADGPLVARVQEEHCYYGGYSTALLGRELHVSVLR